MSITEDIDLVKRLTGTYEADVHAGYYDAVDRVIAFARAKDEAGDAAVLANPAQTGFELIEPTKDNIRDFDVVTYTMTQRARYTVADHGDDMRVGGIWVGHPDLTVHRIERAISPKGGN